MMRAAILGAVVIVAVGVAALLLFGGGHPYSVAEIAVAPGVKVRVVDGPWPGDAECRTNLGVLAAPIAKGCASCAVATDCKSAIDDELASAMASKPVGAPYVRLGSQRDVIDGPGPVAADLCRQIAADARNQGQPADCVLPKP